MVPADRDMKKQLVEGNVRIIELVFTTSKGTSFSPQSLFGPKEVKTRFLQVHLRSNNSSQVLRHRQTDK